MPNFVPVIQDITSTFRLSCINLNLQGKESNYETDEDKLQEDMQKEARPLKSNEVNPCL